MYSSKFIKYIINLLFLLTMLAISILSLLPQSPALPSLIDNQDKIEHYLAYSLLGLLTYFVASQLFKAKRTGLLVPVIFCLLYGSIIEFLQRYTGRHFEYADIIVNLFGGITGTLLAAFIRKNFKAYKKNQDF